jgi:SAM-dependent methyltransferase
MSVPPSNATLGERVAAYLNSPQFVDIPSHGLTEYWQYHHAQAMISVEGDTLSATGKSGFYSPSLTPPRPRSHWLTRLRNFGRDPLGYPGLIARELARRIHRRFDLERRFAEKFPLRLANVDYATAFDAVMSHHPEAEVDLSPSRLDFRKVAGTPGCQPMTAAVAADYRALSGGVRPHDQIYRAYYLANVLTHVGAFDGNFCFLEIGAGSGNLAHLMLRHAKRTSYIVDLPRTLCGAVAYLSRVMPALRLLLPNEAESAPHRDIDLVFVTPAQLHLIPDRVFTLAVNTASFQEMTPAQVGEYFALVDRVVRPGGVFACYNRVEKVPGDDTILTTESHAAVMRFAEYPWRPGRETLVHEVCRFARLTQRDNIMLRIERLPSA